VKALRKRDARNAQALRLAHVAAGKGVGADHLAPRCLDTPRTKVRGTRQPRREEAAPQGKPVRVSPPEFEFRISFKSLRCWKHHSENNVAFRKTVFCQTDNNFRVNAVYYQLNMKKMRYGV
jgi:hypothetical protein